MRVRMSRWISVICKYLLACVAVLHTPVRSARATAIMNATRRNKVGVCGLNALLTYV